MEQCRLRSVVFWSGSRVDAKLKKYECLYEESVLFVLNHRVVLRNGAKLSVETCKGRYPVAPRIDPRHCRSISFREAAKGAWSAIRGGQQDGRRWKHRH